ncbi:hypothetical protein IAT38_007614 [Cryptococcus sp. DSM 104549]
MSSEQQYQNIIIVGASISGHHLSNTLFPHLPPTYRILLVDALPFAFWPIAAFRAATVPGWENKITVPLTDDRCFPAGSAHRVLAPNKLVECRENSVVLEHPFEGSTEVPFYRCVIATGTSQAAPMVPNLDWTEQQYLECLRENQRELKAAKDVVIIGGGAVGIEFAGEIRDIAPDSNITIVHPDVGLLHPTPKPTQETLSHPAPSYSSPPVDPRLSAAFADICAKMNISIIYEDRVIIPQPGEEVPQGGWDGTCGKSLGEKRQVRLKSGEVLDADYVILGAGTKPNSGMVEKADKGALDGRLIRVDEYFKIVSTSESSIFHGQYYAVGDVCSAPGYKDARTALYGGIHAANNIRNELKNKALAKYNPGKGFIGIPVGHHHGAGMMEVPWFGNWIIGSRLITLQRGKTLAVPRFFAGSFLGPNKVKISFDDLNL